MASDDDKKKDQEGSTEQPSGEGQQSGESEALVRAQSDQLAESDHAESDQLAESAPAESPSEAEDAREQASAEEEEVAAQLGAERYVHAAFFGAGILAAYLMGKILLTAWNSLADWPEAVRTAPWLISYAEDERASYTLIVGAVVGVLLVLRYYRRPAVKSWATDVAGELSRVTWPNRETVTNGTLVVLIAGAVATFYVAVLDRLWGYLTNLVYGA